MITNTGKSIVTKYLLGQTPSYASHIAIGCGAAPSSAISFSITNKAMASGVVTLTIPNHTFSINDYITISGIGSGFDGVFQITSITTGVSGTIVYTNSSYLSTTVTSIAISPNGTATKNYSTKTNLDFEMLRVPITSRGFVTENGISKIVLTAQLPTEERYEISEIGIYPSDVNPSAGAYDSKTLLSFNNTESWKLNSTSALIPTITEKLNNDVANTGTITGIYPFTGQTGSTTYSIFQTQANNVGFNNETRINRQERCRYFNNVVMLRGDLATLGTPAGSTSIYDMSIGTPTDFVKLSSNISLTNYSSTDELRLAFSVINKVAADGTTPTLAKIAIRFVTAAGEYASFWVNQSVSATNRYYVVAKKLQDIYKTTAFSWDAVTQVYAYASVEVSTTPSANYYIALDALRIENVTTTNPLYGLTGYTVVQNLVGTYPRPVIKDVNTSSYVEFRLIADVV